MGNSSSSADKSGHSTWRDSEQLDHDDSLTQAEEASLAQIFNCSSQCDPKKNGVVNFEIAQDAFVGVFGSSVCPQYGSNLYALMSKDITKTNKKLDYLHFRKSIIHACKTTPSNCTRMVFECFQCHAPPGNGAGCPSATIAATVADGKGNNGKVGEEEDAGSDHIAFDVIGFLRLVCEFGGGGGCVGFEAGDEAQGDEKEEAAAAAANIDMLAHRLWSHLTRFLRKSRKQQAILSGSYLAGTEGTEAAALRMPVGDEKSTEEPDLYSFEDVNMWVNDYFPCIHKVLLTYFNVLCFRDTSINSPTSTFGPFRPPIPVSGEREFRVYERYVSTSAGANFLGFKQKLKKATVPDGGSGVVLEGNAACAPTDSTMVSPEPTTAVTPDASDPDASDETNHDASEPPMANGAIRPPALTKTLASHNEIFLLSLHSTMLQGCWSQLYSSDKNGMSFNRVAHHLLGYQGPTCILIRCSGEPQETIIGMFSESRWKDSNRFYGTADNILFSLSPQLNIYRAAGGSGSSVGDGCSSSSSSSHGANTNCSTNYQYLNIKTYGYPHGLGMGGSLDKFRFFIPDNMDEGTSNSYKVCVANASDLTYESGDIIPSAPIRNSSSGLSQAEKDAASISSIFSGMNTESSTFGGNSGGKGMFNIDCLEIWACGGTEYIAKGLFAQSKDRDIRDANVRKAQQCDKAAFYGNKFDQEFLLSKTFAHKQNNDRDLV